MIQCTVFDTALYLFACVGGCKDCLMFDQALLCKHPSIRLSSAIQAEVRLSEERNIAKKGVSSSVLSIKSC